MPKSLSLTGAARPRIGKNPVVVMVAGLHKGVVEAVEYAKSISPNVTALTVDLDPTQTTKLRLKWAEWAPDVPLVDRAGHLLHGLREEVARAQDAARPALEGDFEELLGHAGIHQVHVGAVGVPGRLGGADDVGDEVAAIGQAILPGMVAEALQKQIDLAIDSAEKAGF